MWSSVVLLWKKDIRVDKSPSIFRLLKYICLCRIDMRVILLCGTWMCSFAVKFLKSEYGILYVMEAFVGHGISYNKSLCITASLAPFCSLWAALRPESLWHQGQSFPSVATEHNHVAWSQPWFAFFFHDFERQTSLIGFCKACSSVLKWDNYLSHPRHTITSAHLGVLKQTNNNHSCRKLSQVDFHDMTLNDQTKLWLFMSTHIWLQWRNKQLYLHSLENSVFHRGHFSRVDLLCIGVQLKAYWSQQTVSGHS